MQVRNTRHILTTAAALAGLALLGLSVPPAAAQTSYIPNSTTINYAISGDVFVGYASQSDINNGVNRTSPTVNIVGGGSARNLTTLNSSLVNVSGGSLGNVQPFDTSTVNVSGGSLGNLLAGSGSVGNVSGGTFNSLGSNNSSTVTITGGTFASAVDAYDGSTLTVSGGTFGKYDGANFYTNTTGAFTFVGTGLSAVAVASNPNRGTDYVLTGLLQSGQSITGDVIVVRPFAKRFVLVNAAPEPSQSAAFGLGVLGLSVLGLRARRRAALDA